LRFPALPRVSHEAIDLMQQLLCESEDRLGSQASSSVVRPNSMIVQARRSALITPSGATRVGDGAEVIKASRARKNWGGGGSLYLIVLTQLCRHTLSFVGLTGLIFIVILLHSVPNSIIPRTRGTLTMTFQLRWVRCFLFLPTAIRSLCSRLLQPMVLLQMLLEIHCCVTRSMDRKS
jgi:hypothetical protein